MISKIIYIVIILYLSMAVLAFLYNLWNAKVGDLILWASPIIILYVIFKLWIYRQSINRKLYEKKTGEEIIVRIMWSNSKLFHRSYCVDTVGQESNWYVIDDIQKAISEGYTPCQNVAHYKQYKNKKALTTNLRYLQ